MYSGIFNGWVPGSPGKPEQQVVASRLAVVMSTEVYQTMQRKILFWRTTTVLAVLALGVVIWVLR